MARIKKHGKSQTDKSASASGESAKPDAEQQGRSTVDPQLSASEWSDRKRPARRSFPGPRMLDAALRVAVERGAHAELIAHAKELLDTEVCGVLVGEVCEDDEGLFVHVKDVIRGAAADQGSTHVTYTQETWSLIHKTMEERFPKLQIVGWYHSHPGYGVEFSEMDRFIQKNFFSAPTQIGLVIDPLRGDFGLCVNADDEIKYINRFWVDGREQRASVPAGADSNSSPAGKGESAVDGRLESVEVRLEQALRALDDLRTTIHRFVLSLGLIAGVAVVFAIGYTIYSNYLSSAAPPALRSYAPIPIKLGDKVVILGVDVVGWQVPGERVPKENTEQPGSNENSNQSAQPQPGQQSMTGGQSPPANGNASIGTQEKAQGEQPRQ